MKTKDQIVEDLIGVIGEIVFRNGVGTSARVERYDVVSQHCFDAESRSELVGFIRGVYGVWTAPLFITIDALADEIIACLGKEAAQ